MALREDVIVAVHDLDAARSAEAQAEAALAMAKERTRVASARLDALIGVQPVLPVPLPTPPAPASEESIMDRVRRKGAEVGTADVAVVAIAAYGELTDRTRHRARAIMHALKNKGEVEMLGGGRYRFRPRESAPPDPAPPASEALDPPEATQ